jgi:foldase protein PrsA
VRRLRFFILPILGAALLALASACGGGDGDEEAAPAIDVPADAVAVVDSTAIPRADFDRLFAQYQAAYEAQGRDFPQAGTPEYETLRNQTVEFLIDRAIREKEAAALGIEVTDAEVQEELEKLKQQFFPDDDAAYRAELEKQGLTEADVVEDLRARLVSQKIFDQVTEGQTVTQAEIDAYYEENKEQFTTPESREVAHILVEEKELADDLYAQLEDGADFAKLAKEHSTDTASAGQGGKLTDVRGSFVPEFEEVAFALETGEVGKPVESQFGWHVIKALEDTTPEKTTSLAEVQDTIREQLLTDKRNKLMTDWVREARAKYAGLIGYAAGFEPDTQPLPTGTGAGETGVPAETSP